MLSDTFYLDGVDARSVGIYLQKPIVFSEAIPSAESETIPGRNGNLIFYTGSYENRSGSASCFCLQKNVEKAISSAGRFLMGKKGYRRLETSDDPDHYWLARVVNSPEINMRLKTLAPFKIEFDCKPQRFLKSGEFPIDFSESIYLFNQYGQVALPTIILYGEETPSVLTVGDCVVNISKIKNYIRLDSETQNAYNLWGNENGNINAPVFPVLGDGLTRIKTEGGITSGKIIPRWWEL